MMRRCFASAALALVLLEPSHAHSLRAITDDSSCNGATDESSCLSTVDKETGGACVWCKCAAIPSECLNQEQAKQVPEGVFDCSSSPSSEESSFLKDHITLVAHSVDDDLCDQNSKSGYLSVKGSQYDENDEDKHLFYWMFEKRNQKEGETDIPFVVWLTGGPGCSSTLVRTHNGTSIHAMRTLYLISDSSIFTFSHRHSYPRMVLARFPRMESPRNSIPTPGRNRLTSCGWINPLEWGFPMARRRTRMSK